MACFEEFVTVSGFAFAIGDRVRALASPIPVGERPAHWRPGTIIGVFATLSDGEKFWRVSYQVRTDEMLHGRPILTITGSEGLERL